MDQEELNSTIVTYNEYLQKLAAATEHFCTDLSESNFQEISPVLPALVEGLAWINTMIENFIKLNYLTKESMVTFKGLLQSLNESLENQDYPLLRDICEFELLPLLEQIRISEIRAN